jgi:hypothetical protein
MVFLHKLTYLRHLNCWDLVFMQNVQQRKPKGKFRQWMMEVDYIGPLLFIPGIVCLLLALQWGGVTTPWRSPVTIGLFVGASILIPLWMYSQHRLGERATVPIRLIVVRTVFFAAIYGFFFYGSFVILTFYLPLYFQAIKGSSATVSAIDTLPLLISLTISSITGGVLLSTVGYCAPFMIVGTLIMIAGVGLLSTAGTETSFGALLGYQVIVGAGLGVNLTVLYPESKTLIIRPQISLCNQ